MRRRENIILFHLKEEQTNEMHKLIFHLLINLLLFKLLRRVSAA